MAKKKVEQENVNTAKEGDLGKLLISLRENAGYSLSQTAEAMCLSEEILVRLENEEFNTLPEPPYIRGYLRNYAKFADVDAQELVSCYESLRGADPSDLNYHFKSSAKIHSQQKKKVSPIVMQLLFLAVLLAGLVGLSMIPAVNQLIKKTWNNFSVQANSPSISNTDNPLLTGTMPVPTPLPSDTTETEVGKIEQITTPDTTTEQATTSTQNNDTATHENTPKNGTPESSSESEGKKTESLENTVTTEVPESIKVGEENKNEALIPAATDGSINIKLVFNQEVWMRIRDSKKKTVFEGQNAAGQEKELQLKKPLSFRVGNAHGLSLFVDGKAVDISRYIKGSVANFTLE